MSMLATPVLDAYEHARMAFTQNLNAKKCARIFGNTPVSLKDLVDQVVMQRDRLHQKHKRKAWSRLGDRVALLEPSEKLVEGTCKLCFDGELLWGSVSFILQLTKNDVKVFDEVSFFETVAEEVSHINLQDQTFATSTLVQLVVEASYAAIIDFWVEAVLYYRSRFGDELAKQKNRLHAASSAQHNANSTSFYNESQYLQCFEH
ncbi:hypothetical protein DXG01_013291 [Tephrocybe rancida]|nr:hypothetical protein DXG01_013291 [Tephrocybe rancida]